MEIGKVETLAQTALNQHAYLIGISGIPGAGKTCIAQQLATLLPKSIVVPLDGYHLYRKDLDEEGIKYRGAPFTFDLPTFRDKILEVSKRDKFPVRFPSFDHALKDPQEDDIVLNQDIRHVIVEGIYIFDKSIALDDCWDLKIWVDTDIQVSMQRLTIRNYKAGLSPSIEAARERTEFSDRKNALHVLCNSLTNNCRVVSNN